MIDRWNYYCYYDFSTQGTDARERIKRLVLADTDVMTDREFILEQAHFMRRVRCYDRFRHQLELSLIVSRVGNWIYVWRFQRSFFGLTRLHNTMSRLLESPCYPFGHDDMDSCLRKTLQSHL